MAENMTSGPPAADPFTEYYARESLSEATRARFAGTKDAIFCVLRQRGLPCERLTVADIGCGAATQAILWARDGHRVFGADINEQLIALGRERVREAGVRVELEAASAVRLPWASQSMDVCLLPELLEHVRDWRKCLSEAARLLKPSGLLFISTTNRLCPVQQEFELPFYSWYPARLKRRFERLATTTRPDLVNNAEFPAVHWFDFYSLRRAPELSEFTCLDRFDVAALRERGAATRTLLKLITQSPLLRGLAHVATPYTTVFAIRSRPMMPDARQ
ncbi:MAG: class I SAM-dependent methyltransferase [Gammaproteobacteria bacterium]